MLLSAGCRDVEGGHRDTPRLKLHALVPDDQNGDHRGIDPADHAGISLPAKVFYHRADCRIHQGLKSPLRKIKEEMYVVPLKKGNPAACSAAACIICDRMLRTAAGILADNIPAGNRRPVVRIGNVNSRVQPIPGARRRGAL